MAPDEELEDMVLFRFDDEIHQGVVEENFASKVASNVSERFQHGCAVVYREEPIQLLQLLQPVVDESNCCLSSLVFNVGKDRDMNCAGPPNVKIVLEYDMAEDGRRLEVVKHGGVLHWTSPPLDIFLPVELEADDGSILW